jgi:hypothetical protein
MAPESQPPNGEAQGEVEKHKRQTLAGSYLERALDELRASGSSDMLYPAYSAQHEGVRTSRGIRGALGERIAKGRRREFTRSAVLFAMLAAEAYANQYLQIHLTGEEAKAADRLPTFEKFVLGPRLARGEKLLDRGREPAQTLKRLLDQRSVLVHPKLASSGGRLPSYTPLQAAEFIVAVADAAGWLIANSDPRPRLDMAVIAVDQERAYFLDFGHQATEQLPKYSDPPAPELVLAVWTRWADEAKAEEKT